MMDILFSGKFISSLISEHWASILIIILVIIIILKMKGASSSGGGNRQRGSNQNYRGNNANVKMSGQAMWENGKWVNRDHSHITKNKDKYNKR